MRDQFLKSVVVLDTETTHMKPHLAEIVEIAGAIYDGQNWVVKSSLVGSRAPIPPEASAKNNISNRMISGLKTFAEQVDQMIEITNWNKTTWYVAHNCPYDQTVLANSWKDAGKLNFAAQAADKSKWICTYRLSQHLLSYSFDSMQYNLSYLRYRLDLPIPDDTSVHRAGADTWTCAVLFEFLVDYALSINAVTDQSDLGEQLNQLCWQPIITDRMPFGKHRGQLFSNIDTSYFMWAMKNMSCFDESHEEYDADLSASLAIELNRRLTQKDHQ